MAVDAVVVAACWNITYLFRLGFERWISARPPYDGWVLLGVVAVYLLAGVACKVPQSMWRFSGFAEIKRLTVACAIGGAFSAAFVMGLGLRQVPRAVLALHPIVTLMGLAVVRIAYRMTYEHARSRIAGGDGVVRRALVLGAGAAARLLLAGLQQQGWTVIGLLDDDPAKRGARIGGVPVLGPLALLAEPVAPAAAYAA
ncbi:MAG: polysaccharide biosynthesis protein, partial [Burkholderiales bacterium]|nr:polysaccharide biosynthesis protein [Burkholderiales bacterium]